MSVNQVSLYGSANCTSMKMKLIAVHEMIMNIKKRKETENVYRKRIRENGEIRIFRICLGTINIGSLENRR